MDTNTIKFKTIQFISGIKHLPKEKVEDLKHIMCGNLGIEKNEKNFKAVEDGVKAYFRIMNEKDSSLNY